MSSSAAGFFADPALVKKAAKANGVAGMVTDAVLAPVLDHMGLQGAPAPRHAPCSWPSIIGMAVCSGETALNCAFPDIRLLDGGNSSACSKLLIFAKLKVDSG